MSKINLITSPDVIYSDVISILLIAPKDELLSDLQKEILPLVNEGLNIYLYDKQNDFTNDIDWIMRVFAVADITLIDVDECRGDVRDLLSYFIAKPKTFWLTSSEHSVYNCISSNRIYNTSFLYKMFDTEESDTQQ